MDFASIISTVNNALWATPLIALIFVGALIYCFAIKFANISKLPLQIKLLISGDGSKDGLSAYETFCSVAAYRVAVGNIGGVMVAIMYGGPGAVFWMLVTALVTSAIAYAENSLGQIYKVRQDGQYRGGPFNYMEMGIPWKGVGKVFAIIFALMVTIGVPLLVTGPSANNIAMALENSFGMNHVVSGAIIAVLLFLVISGGIRRIAKFSTMIVPIMTIAYLVVTVIVLIFNAAAIPSTIAMIVGSAFNTHAIFGGMIGGAFSYGVKRGVNSSGSGFGETPAIAAAAESKHPAVQGLVNASSVYIDVIVCFCSGIMALVTDCFNVLGPDGTFMHIGEGSAQMATQAATNTAGVVWVQEAANTAIPGIGGMIIALALTCFAYSTCIGYYYEGEAGLAYLARNLSQSTRDKMIWATRIMMPIFFFAWANVTASTAWAISEVMFGLMAWLNGITLLILLPVVKKVYDDYMEQRKAGVEEPYFNPEKLGIKNCDVWMDINAELIKKDTKA
jgi:AGCS family alanine or glycine:cation symporter|nr:alanine/glycine:cation symporter family protein [uncultured Oscillibacter sp.]